MSVEFKDNSDAWAKAIVESCNAALTSTGAMAADAMRQNIGSEGGRAIAVSRKVRNSKRRKYRQLLSGESVGGREGRRLWEASPPGKFPGSRTGALRRSMSSTKSTSLSVLVGSSLNYALFLETGWERRKPLTDKQLRMLHAMRRDLEDSGIATINKGGAGGGKVYARPWLRRTMREEGPRLGQHFADVASAELARRTAQ